MKTILIADDDKKITVALARRLESAGYEVVTATNGSLALKAAVDSKPDLILLDIWMPITGGFVMAERLRARGSTIPILFLTASRKHGLWAAAQEVGASGFIEKPYDPDELLETIQQTLYGSTYAA